MRGEPVAVEHHRVPDATRTSSDSDATLDGYAEARAFVIDRLRRGMRVAVHCNAGFQRSVPFLAYVLMDLEDHGTDDEKLDRSLAQLGWQLSDLDAFSTPQNRASTTSRIRDLLARFVRS